MPRKECCRSTAAQMFDAVAASDEMRPDSAFEAMLIASISRYPLLEEFLDQRAEVRVALLPPGESATIYKTSCSTCKHLVSLIIVGSPLLRAMDDLFDLFGSLITRWDRIEGTVHHEQRMPDEKDIQRFEEIVSEYVRAKPAADSHLGRRLAEPRVPKEVRDSMVKFVEIGQLWIVAHELAHAL